MRGRWWRTFGVIALGFLLAIVISTLARGVFLLGLLIADDDALVLTLSALAGIVGLAVSAPFQAALLTVLYFDTRVRTEDFDLERLAGEIGAEPPADGAGPPPAALVAPTPARSPSDKPLWPSPPAGQDDGPRSRARPSPDAPPPPPGWRPPSRPSPPDGDDGASFERGRG